jgi:hypothetical protein
MLMSKVTEGAVTVKTPAETVAPARVVTENFPVVAPFGTMAVIWVELLTVKLAAVPFSATLLAPVRFVPERVTELPACPLAGTKPVIVGKVAGAVTRKSVADIAIPVGVVTEIFPLDAPLGTAAEIRVALVTENAAAVPLKETDVAPVRFAPRTVTEVVMGPLAG